MTTLKGVRIEPEGDVSILRPLVPHDEWSERWVSTRAIGLFGAEFIFLRWFIDNIMTGAMGEAMDKLMMEQESSS